MLITPNEIMDLETFSKKKNVLEKEIIEIKKNRRVALGPDITFYFENYKTIWWQIQQMLWIEKGGEEQLQDELLAYNPLIPQGGELITTMMIEIDDPIRRKIILMELSNIEKEIFLQIGAQRVFAEDAASSDNVERLSEDGKTSAVHFLRFPIAKDDFLQNEVSLNSKHPKYSFSAKIIDDVKVSLAKEL